MTTETVIGSEGDVAMIKTTDYIAHCGRDSSVTVARLHARPKPATVLHRSGFEMTTGNTSVTAVIHVANDPVQATALS